MPAAMKNIIALAVIFFISLVDAVPYSKYGRTCNDIGCPSSEVCVIAEDPCTYSNSQCGRYPTCKKLDSGAPTCSTMNCPTGQKCRMDSGRPVCVKSQGFEPSLNVQDNNYDHGSHTANSNPFQNANAPPAEDIFGPPVKPYPGNSGYPPYPSNSGSNNGYPPYPTNQGTNHQPNRNDGYPPYPTNNNRMPLPGQSSYPYGQPGYSQPGQYPNHPPPGYQSPNQRYPNYPSPNYPNQNYYPQSNTRNYNPYSRRNGSSSLVASSLMMFTTSCFALFAIFRNSFVP